MKVNIEVVNPANNLWNILVTLIKHFFSWSVFFSFKSWSHLCFYEMFYENSILCYLMNLVVDQNIHNFFWVFIINNNLMILIHLWHWCI
jgi:hypothetical protein